MKKTEDIINKIINREVNDEIYSQSDASNYRDEEMLIGIDNNISKDINS